MGDFHYCDTCETYSQHWTSGECDTCIRREAFEFLHTVTVDDLKGLSKGNAYTYYYDLVCEPRIDALTYERDSDEYERAKYIIEKTFNEAYKAYVWPKRGNNKGAKPASERASIRAAEALALTKKITTDAIDLHELEVRANKVIEALINAKNKQQQPLVSLDAVQHQQVEEMIMHIATVMGELEKDGCVTVGSTEMLLRMLSLSLP